MIKYYPLVVFLMGPTASHKTSLAIFLKRHELFFNRIKIISVDSVLIYKGMDIGSAKPSKMELKYAPHKLIDIKDPAEYYSIADFYCDAVSEIRKIVESGCTPLLVGGTMLYFRVLLNGLYCLPKTDQVLRHNLIQKAQKIGWMSMYNQLKYIDPIASSKIHYNDHKRVLRALEIFFISGRTQTELQDHFNLLSQYKILQFAVMPSTREILNIRIKKRFYQMLECGFENEVSMLFKRSDLHIGIKPAICAAGYRQMWEYLSGKITYSDMVLKGLSAHRRLAKHQLTWLRKWSNLNWIIDDNMFIASNFITKIVSKNYSSVIKCFND